MYAFICAGAVPSVPPMIVMACPSHTQHHILLITDSECIVALAALQG